MKVVLYRGPRNGHVLMVPDSHVRLTVSMFKPEDMMNYSSMVPLTPKTYTYRKTNHTRPDGAVYFEWDQPRGTKI